MLMTILYYLASVLGFGLLNRFRGGGILDIKGGATGHLLAPLRLNLPGRQMHWAAMIAFAVVLFTTGFNYQLAGAFALAYTVWGTLGWGRWYDLGRMPDGYNRQGKAYAWYETIIERLSTFGGKLNDYVAMFWRHSLFGMVPAMAVLALGHADPSQGILPFFQSARWDLLIHAVPLALGVIAIYAAMFNLTEALDLPYQEADHVSNPIFLSELAIGAFIWAPVFLFLL